MGVAPARRVIVDWLHSGFLGELPLVHAADGPLEHGGELRDCQLGVLRFSCQAADRRLPSARVGSRRGADADEAPHLTRPVKHGGTLRSATVSARLASCSTAQTAASRPIDGGA